MIDLQVTTHAKKRLSERVNVSKKKQRTKYVNNMLHRGKNPADFGDDFAMFLDYKKNKYNHKVHVKVYDNHVFVYRSGALITTYKVPKRFLPVKDYFKGTLNQNKLYVNFNRETGNLKRKFKVVCETKTRLDINLYLDDKFVCSGSGKNLFEAKMNCIENYNKLKESEGNNVKDFSNINV